jgi:hypothetical protein
MTNPAALRRFDESYKTSRLEMGAQEVVFYSLNGQITVRADRFVREGDSFILCKEHWDRGGSSDVSLRIPGMGDDLVLQSQTQNAFIFRSYSDMAWICLAPAQNVYVKDIDNDANS